MLLLLLVLVLLVFVAKVTLVVWLTLSLFPEPEVWRRLRKFQIVCLDL